MTGKRESEEPTVAIGQLGGKSQNLQTRDNAVQALVDEPRSPFGTHLMATGIGMACR